MWTVCARVCLDVAVRRGGSRALLATADRSFPRLRRVDKGQRSAAGPAADQRADRHRILVDVLGPTATAAASTSAVASPGLAPALHRPRGSPGHPGRRRDAPLPPLSVDARPVGTAASADRRQDAAARWRHRQRATSPQEGVSDAADQGQM